MFKPKRILIPMDFSDEAMLALDWAVMIAKQLGEVTLYPAYVSSTTPDLVALDVGKTRYKEVTRQWIEDKMQNLQMKLSKTVPCEPIYATGNPATEIVDLCRRKGMDLVVTTTHGREGISRLFHRSVAEAIVHSAPCPVLVLHMNWLTLDPVRPPDQK